MKKQIISKPLTKTDINKRLSVPSKSLSSFPSFNGNQAVNFPVEDESGVVWIFPCYTRKKNYKKPVLSGPWTKFVSSNNLNIGDKVKIFMEEDEAIGAKYSIKVEKQKAVKPVMLFGVIIGYAAN